MSETTELWRVILTVDGKEVNGVRHIQHETDDINAAKEAYENAHQTIAAMQEAGLISKEAWKKMDIFLQHMPARKWITK